jgi:hypothetical protein
MKRALGITFILILVIIGIGIFLLNNKSDIKINEIQKRGSSSYVISYSFLGGLENPECVLNVKRGDIEKIEFPLSCPGVVFPKGSHSCNAQSNSAILGDNQLEVWKSEVDLTEASSLEICCIDSEFPINSPENVSLSKKDFICSSSYEIK